MKNDYPPTVMFKNTDLNTTWAMAVYTVSKFGKILPASPNYTDNPNHVILLTKDICATFEYTDKALRDIKNRIIHEKYPHHRGYEQYEAQFKPGTPEFEHGKTFHYYYAGRLRRFPSNKVEEDFIDQLKFIAEHLDAFNRRLQAITWITETDLPAAIVDEDKQSVPCLQRVQLRNLGNGYYEILLNWRSRDLYKAYLWNILGLINSIDELVQASRLRLGQEPLELVKVVDHISSLHIYETEWEDAKKIPIDIPLFSKCVFI